jgi:hypothetical protein
MERDIYFGGTMNTSIEIINACGVIWGYFYSVFVGGLIIYFIVDVAWKVFETHKESEIRKKFNYATILSGCIDRIIYTTSIVFCSKEFIAVWIGIRVISHWSKWDGININGEIAPQPKDGEIEKYKGRARYQIFLAGNGLSIMFGVLGGQIINWVNNKNYIYPIGYSLLLSNIGVLIFMILIVVLNNNSKIKLHLLSERTKFLQNRYHKFRNKKNTD